MSPVLSIVIISKAVVKVLISIAVGQTRKDSKMRLFINYTDE